MAKGCNLKRCWGCAFWMLPLTAPFVYYLFGTLGLDILAGLMLVLVIYGFYTEHKEYEENNSPQWLKDMKEEERNPDAKYLKKFQEDVYACSGR